MDSFVYHIKLYKNHIIESLFIKLKTNLTQETFHLEGAKKKTLWFQKMDVLVYTHVRENWVRNPILMSLNWVVVRSRNDNLIEVIMEAFLIGGGLPWN
jgi:hypothetical protein